MSPLIWIQPASFGGLFFVQTFRSRGALAAQKKPIRSETDRPFPINGRYVLARETRVFVRADRQIHALNRRT